MQFLDQIQCRSPKTNVLFHLIFEKKKTKQFPRLKISQKKNSKNNSLNLWIVSDNLLRGAALNAVEIAETYFRMGK